LSVERKLHVIGTGIKSISHLTKESIAAVATADIVFYLVNEPILKEWVLENNKKCVSLDPFYDISEKRETSYKAIIKQVKKACVENNNVALLLYGHPLVCCSVGENLSHLPGELDGLEVVVYPSISAEDCLYADLSIDPLNKGCLSLEATDYLLLDKCVDTSCHLILWQVGMVGNFNLPDAKGLCGTIPVKLLAEKLLKIYPNETECFIYEASLYPGLRPTVRKIALFSITEIMLFPISTLYVPPQKTLKINMDIARKIGIEINDRNVEKLC
jgi:uncharacterized protein YabN with tetrapyrrole methylase and pyrophosphatase domain